MDLRICCNEIISLNILSYSLLMIQYNPNTNPAFPDFYDFGIFYMTFFGLLWFCGYPDNIVCVTKTLGAIFLWFQSLLVFATFPTILKLSMWNFNTTFLNILRRQQQRQIFEFVKKKFLGLKMSKFLPIFGHKKLFLDKFKNRPLLMPAQYIQEGCVKIWHW